MSLVAYAASSDEDSDSDEETKLTVVSGPLDVKNTSVASKTMPSETILDEHISDEDDDFTPVKVDLQQIKKITLSLPAPKNPNDDKTLSQELENKITPAFAKLPTPKSCNMVETSPIEEEDDEFLHKKAIPSLKDEQRKPSPPILRGPVKITIPSLREYSDVDKEIAHKAKSKTECVPATKGCGLLSILPKAKSEQDFRKTENDSPVKTHFTITSKAPTLIPDTVRARRPAQNTEIVDGLRIASKKPLTKAEKPKMPLADHSDSNDDASDNEIDSGKDFFSLNSADTLPEVSANEINAMVANRAAQMAEAKNKYFNSSSTSTEVVCEKPMDEEEDAKQQARKRYHDLDSEALQALVGGSKRRRKQEEIQIMDISGEEVLPNRDEWMRTALTSSTTYQPTGVLVDEEPVSGTRRKHQITYLAHKAKANEAELQAMWSANRQTRRVTQSKYGF